MNDALSSSGKSRPMPVTRSGTLPATLAVIAFAILQIATPALPALGIGRPIGDQSQMVRTLITPAGWAFAIWGPLYAGSLLFAIYQALPAQRDDRRVAGLRWPVAGAFAGNAVWAAYVQVAGLSAISVVVIGWTLACLLVAYRRLTGWQGPIGTGKRWCAVVPLSALAAWLTVATTVNIAASLRFHGIEAGDAAPLVSAAVVLLAGMMAGAALWRGRGNPAYAVVILWALAAIHAAGGSRAGAVAAATIMAALVVVTGMVLGWRRKF